MIPEYSRVPDGELRKLAVRVSAVRKGEISARKLTRALKNDIKRVEDAAAAVTGWNEKSRLLSEEFEWLLDNRYLISREGMETVGALRCAGKLPKSGSVPAAYAMADILVRSGEVTAERIRDFLLGAREAVPLTESELWIFIPLIRAALVRLAAETSGELLKILEEYRAAEDKGIFSAEARVFAARQSGSVPQESDEELAGEAGRVHRELASIMGAVVSSLRFLSVADLSEVLQESSDMEKTLGEDSEYALMDEQSRSEYRIKLSRLAKKYRINEHEAAARILELCREGKNPRERHVGYYLWEKPLGNKPPALARRLYPLSFAALTLIPAVLCAAVAERAWVGLILLLPFSSLAKNIIDSLASRLVAPRPIPRLELADGIPPEGKTLCVISVLLTDSKKGPEYAAKLESYRFANRDAGEGLVFGLLCDLPDCRQKMRPADEKILEEAQKAIFALNKRYGGGFYIFTRDRVLNTRDKLFIGWERKRGAIVELCRLLRGKDCSLRVQTGDKGQLCDVKYVITLDADTALTPGSARLLAGGMMHVLSKPVIDTEKRIVTHGHALMAPRISVELEAAGKSLFSRIFAGQGGLDPYNGLAGEVYQDIFNAGSFTGKGIIDVDAFLTCLDNRFPENRILSHDLLEGAYLGAGLMGDVELSDGFPARAGAWFDRSHRWIRGDWQAASWLLPRVPVPGGKERNPVRAVSRWKLFDNLRRSMTPLFTLAAITAGVMLSGVTAGILFWSALVCQMSHLVISIAQAAFTPLRRRVRYHATIITGLSSVLCQSAALLLFLPYEALLSLHAATLSMIRVGITKKKLLQWVTSAETESYSLGAVPLARKMFPGLCYGVLTACLAGNGYGWVLGVCWALSPFFTYYISRADKKQPRLTDADRAFLTRQSALMWRYFEDFLTPEDHFLPPDNYQEQPALGVARRTSPTNIGLALLSTLAALDMGLCAKERALRLISGALDTLESLPKWNGHIYNWYDTRTLEPLSPRVVSTVDSGNLCGCLIALSQGLRELEGDETTDLAERSEALAEAMRFEPLYDKKRRLFVISHDMDNPGAQPGYYDLLASEARQTSYIALSRGEVDKKHWQRLGRAQTGLGRYRGMASWTGTMFEYFMPHLLLPAYDNSLLRESLDFCVYAQRQQAARRGGPWGISESCFYAFDPALNYQYKAHGTPALAFKRGLGKDWVIAPYASFLTLLTHPAVSVKNLRKLKTLGLEGGYGLCEAADFTPSRVLSSQRGFEPVKCYMSHHLGMSIIAVCNVLRENIMQERFMRNKQMGAFAGLLRERVPVGAATVRRIGLEVPEKPRRAEGKGTLREVEAVSLDKPSTALLSNSGYTVLCADSGRSLSRCGNITLTRFTTRSDGQELWFFCGGTATSLYAAGAGTESGYSASLGTRRVALMYKDSLLAARTEISVSETENAERRAVKLTNRSKNRLEGELCYYFEPVLARWEDYASHPAFSKLFLETRIESGAALVRRRPRVGSDESWLAFYCSDDSVCYDTSREKALVRGGAAASALRSTPGFTQGAVLDPCVLARIPVKMAPGESVTVSFGLGYAKTAADALAAARHAGRSSGEGSARPDSAARLLGLTPRDCAEALDLIPGMLFSAREPDKAYFDGLRLGAQGLWAVGISGDLPVLLTEAFDSARLSEAGRVIRQHRYLTMSGFECDLAVLVRDGGDYRRPGHTFLMETLKACHSEGSLGVRGGVHIVDLTSLEPGTEALLRAVGCQTGNTPEAVSIPRRVKPFQAAENPHVPRLYWSEGNSFCIESTGELPKLAHSHVLANPGFGALVNESGINYLWYQNSRENKLTPWINDPLAVGGSVKLTMRSDEREASLLAARDGLYCRAEYGFGWAKWEKRTGDITVKTLMYVPPERMALVIEIECGNAEEITLETDILMSSARTGTVVTELRDDGVFCAQNPYNTSHTPQKMLIAASQNPERTASRNAGAALRYKPENGKLIIVIGSSSNAPGEERIIELAQKNNADKAFRRTNEYWNSLVRKQVPTGFLGHYLDGWALYQIIASRLYARASLYQCGGAYGFRDQLQDSCAALDVSPRLTRTQILRAAARQYTEGDVMHWWHPSRHSTSYSDRGVRTRCSDDLLWLPYTLCEYLDKAGGRDILDIRVPYLSSPPLGEDSEDRYEAAEVTRERGSIYEHACRAVDLALHRGVGAHDLCLIGTGDWNDGMNLVGAKGKGESVWLTWFLAHVLQRMIPVCESRGDMARAEHYRIWVDKLIKAGGDAWDGKWFLRGYYDDGSPLGSAANEQCRIDSIAQSFSALFISELPRERVLTALESAYEMLCDEKERVVKLFTPAFTGAGAQKPGYIAGYVPGVRENGGQYTHAAVWLAMGFHKAGMPEKAMKILEMLLPETHDQEKYLAEPYVLAADVYGHPEHLGRGGWSWYTGAAGWFYRIAINIIGADAQS